MAVESDSRVRSATAHADQQRWTALAVMGASLFVLLTLLLSWGAFLLGAPVRVSTASTLAYCLAGLAVLCWRPGAVEQASWYPRLGAVAFAATALSLSLLWAAVTEDTSYDGMMYHQVAVIALRDGWNPWHQPELADWIGQRFDGRGGGTQLGTAATWVTHYPKGSWILGAAGAGLTGSLAAAKWIQGFTVAVSAIAAWRAFSAYGPWPVALAAALAGSLSPVVLAQLSSNYVDGLLSGWLLVAVAATVSWLRTARLEDLVSLICALVVCANLKFTGLVYACLLVPVVAAACWPARVELLGSMNGLVAKALCASLAAAAVIITAPTYVYNWLTGGSPFHPVGSVDFMTSQIGPFVRELGRIESLVFSMWHVPAADAAADAWAAWPVGPRLWHFKALVDVTDIRLGGFGPLFGWALAAALVVGVVAAAASSSARVDSRDKLALRALLLLGAWAVCSTLLNPYPWWARYVPQLWLVPILAAAVLMLMQRHRVAMLLLFPLLTTALASAVFAVLSAASTPSTGAQLARASIDGVVYYASSESGIPGLFALAAHAREAGLDVAPAPPGWACDFRIGIVRVCRAR
jgi:hypothetical protein